MLNLVFFFTFTLNILRNSLQLWIEFQVFFTGLRSKVKCSVLIRWKTDPSHCCSLYFRSPMIPQCGLIVLSPRDWAVIAMSPRCLRWPPHVLSLCNNKHRLPGLGYLSTCTNVHVILFTYIHSTCCVQMSITTLHCIATKGAQEVDMSVSFKWHNQQSILGACTD